MYEFGGNTSVVILAASKALSIWIVLYIVLIHCLILIKWNSTNQTYPISINSNYKTNVTSVSSSKVGGINSSIVDIEYTDGEISVLQQQLYALINSTDDKMIQIMEQHHMMNSIMDEFNSTVQNVVSLVNDDTNNSLRRPELLKLKQLLSIENLDTDLRTASQFTKYVNAAVKEMETNLQQVQFDSSSDTTKSNNVPMDWSVYTNLFRNADGVLPSRRRRSKDDNNSNQCSNSVDGDGDNTTAIRKYATQDDIFDFIQSIRSKLLSELYTSDSIISSNGLPVSFPTTKDLLRTNLIEMIDDIVSSQQQELLEQEAADSDDEDMEVSTTEASDTNQLVCLSDHETNIIQWVEAGLHALDRNYDIRSAILSAMEQNDIDTSNIILDADLSSSNTNINSNVSSKTKTTINLRQLLDTEAFHQTVLYVDTVIDSISGYSTTMDELFEKYIWSQVPPDQMNEPDIIAKTMTQYLFQNMIGKIDIPISPATTSSLLPPRRR